MKYLLILNGPPDGTERCYNGLRLAMEVDGARRSTMDELAATLAADKVLVF
jgi:sulfur relay (sulfurtransferase) complex TusBCD TusD component (DsrE family)